MLRLEIVIKPQYEKLKKKSKLRLAIFWVEKIVKDLQRERQAESVGWVLRGMLAHREGSIQREKSRDLQRAYSEC